MNGKISHIAPSKHSNGVRVASRNNQVGARPIKILFVSPVGQLHGGGEKSGLEFCKYLTRYGFEIETVLPESDNEGYIDELKKHDMKYHIAPYNFHNINSSFDLDLITLRESFGVVDIVHKVKPDIIISNISAFTHGALAAAITNTPHVWMERGNGYRIEEDWVRNILDFVFKYSNAVIVNSLGLSNIYQEHYGVKPAVVRSFTAAPSAGLNKEIKETRIIAVSRLTPQKNIEELLRAVEILLENYPDLRVKTVIMGYDEGTGKQLKDYVKDSKNLTNKVDFVDFQPHPWQSFGLNDIYVNSSLYESIGRSTIEAILLGLPVVLADIPGHEDIFELVGGYKYKSGSPEDLSEKLYHVITNQAEAKKQAAVWKELVQDKFSEDNCNKEAVTLIKSLVGQDNPVSSSEIFEVIYSRANLLLDKRINQIDSLQRQVEVVSNPGIKRSSFLLREAIKRKIRRN